MSDQLFPGSPGDMLDIVEKLRAENERIHKAWQASITERGELLAEIMRLRELLTDIVKLSEDGTAAKMISAAALEEKQHEPG